MMPNDHKNSGRLNLFEIISILGYHKKKIFISTAIILAAALTWLFLTPNYYSSQAALLPRDNPGMYSWLRHYARIGAIDTPYDANSSMLYPEMLNSFRVTNHIMANEYTFMHNGKEMHLTLSDYFGINNVDELRGKLKKILNIDYDKYGTGVIYLVATTKYPGFSQKILKRTIEALDMVTREQRRGALTGILNHIDEEITGVRSKLALAEDRLDAFKLANRDYYQTTDPDLLMTLGQLQREIKIQEEALKLLEDQANQARISAAQNDIPLKILDSPTLPEEKSAPYRVITAVMLGVIGFLLSAAAVLYLEFFREWSGMSAARFLKGITDESKLPEHILG
jgi:LPS O-antigen subunit length determinant protein (WzzB/FepE family)